MKNFAGRGGCYPPKPTAEVDKTLRDILICRILHILRKPNSIFALLFIQNIFFAQTCKDVNLLAAISLFVNNTTSSPGFLVNGSKILTSIVNNLQRAALLTSF